ncbi:LppP/LprE family lipoprotein [Corynebacterium suedekumii]|uniref:LppP/LprE family lipoprotein n=1 Tax=Corynebacterium suedekumii TaxID=3049801 RepID=A0ABY8VQ67_9CORY|nr:LppP/LprE family lipoprotein [Corynebacterium suedekumii]WIM70309.1 LppP/LprE family lipoprotein [Corynebacterium suedekumii]WIM72067.1 LppP/LprE family lipoprotein [Corynebacterium suedekumii]
MPRRIPALLVTALALTVAGCSDTAGDQTPVTVTSVVTESAPPPGTTPAEVTTTTAPTQTAAPAPKPDNCGVDPQAATIHDNISQVPEPTLAGHGWEYTGDSNYDPCADLSYALVGVAGSTHAQRQGQLMLFHRGEYLGVGLLVPQVYRNVSGDGTTVYTEVIDYEAMDRDGAANAVAPDYQVPLNFTWTGSQVEPVGRIPNLTYFE